MFKTSALFTMVLGGIVLTGCNKDEPAPTPAPTPTATTPTPTPATRPTVDLMPPTLPSITAPTLPSIPTPSLPPLTPPTTLPGAGAAVGDLDKALGVGGKPATSPTDAPK